MGIWGMVGVVFELLVVVVDVECVDSGILLAFVFVGAV